MQRSMKSGIFLVIFFAAVALCSCNSSNMECSIRETEALLAFKDGVGDPAGRLSTWIRGSDCCQWKGVQCDEATGKVTRLDLRNANATSDIFNSGEAFDDYSLTGRLTNTSLFELQSLEHLDLSSNIGFHGVIPERIDFLKKLRYLNLSGCSFSGIIPPQLGHLSGLHHLDLSSSVRKGLNYNYWKIGGELKSESLSWLRNLSALKFVSLSGVDLAMVGRQWGSDIGSLHNLRSLHLSDCRLSGLIPPPLQNLSSLSYLHLSWNSFSPSHIPSWLSNFTTLVFLHLSGCNLQGPVHPQLLTLPRLKRIYLNRNYLSGNIGQILVNGSSLLSRLSLSSNNLSGAIPSSLPRFPFLTYLNLADNKLSGGIPPSVGGMSSLTMLDLSFNQFEGPISLSVFQNLTELHSLYLSNNRLRVMIPPQLVPSFELYELGLGNCSIGGAVPEFISTQCNLRYLNLSNNHIIGNGIPDSIWDLPLCQLDLSHNNLGGQLNLPSFHAIQVLMLQHNQFTGHIPVEIHSVFPYLSVLSIAGNNLEGSIPSSIGHMQRLEVFEASGNELSGTIPSSLGNCSTLVTLKLASNRLEGGIPWQIGNLSSLEILHLNDNRLTGPLPSYLQNCQQLKILDLGNNRISGNIPAWLGSLSQLHIIVLRSNFLEGHISPEVTSLKDLQILDLSENSLSGPVPQNLAMLTAMTHISYLSSYLMKNLTTLGYYTEEVQLTNKAQTMRYAYDSILSLVTCIDLSQNHLTGNIPSEIGNLNGLIILNISWNHLIGSIPDVFGEAMQLESLDLSHNQLSGKIPTSLQFLGSLGFLNLSYNRLSGTIPAVRHLDTFGATSFLNNPDLCGAPLELNCSKNSIGYSPPSMEMNDDENEAETVLLWCGGLMLGFAVGFWGVFGMLMLNKDL